MRTLLGLFVLTVSACATAPGYRASAVPLPATFREPLPVLAPAANPADGSSRAVQPAVTPAEFWRALGDSTLDRLLEETLRGSPDAQVAVARIRNARAGRAGAALDFAPTVTAVAGFSRSRSPGVGPSGVGTLAGIESWDVGFDAGWELDLFGRIRRTVQGEGALVDAATEDLRDVQVSLTAETARTYFELRGAQSELAAARRNAENQGRTLDLTRQRLESGIGSAFDMERAQAQHSLTLAAIPGLEARVGTAQYRLGVLVGRPPAQVAEELAASAELPALPASLAEIDPGQVVRRRPDVAAAERRAAAGRSFVKAARAEYLPRLSLGGTAGYNSGTFNGLGERGTLRYAVGPVLSWPALNLGRVKARVDASRALEAASQAAYHQATLRALEEIESARIRYRTSLTRVDRVRDAAEASARAAELARIRFTEGVADFLQVLDAERTQLDAELQLVRTRTDAASAYAGLYKALGGDGVVW